MSEKEDEFKQMWTEARVRFEEITKQSLEKTSNRSLDNVLEELDKRFDAHNVDGKQQRVKELAWNVLQIIHVLGGVAAQGASVVFGPANLCFNAMQYIIDMPAKISRFYDDLARLFEEISTFLKQFKIYQRIDQYAAIDVELKWNTHKLMILFVDICAITIDVLSGSRWKRLKIVTQIALFDKDSGVKNKLEEFKRLINHQSQISDAVALEHVLKSELERTSSMNSLFGMLRKTSEENGKLFEEKSQETQDKLEATHNDVRTVKTGTEALVKDANDRNSKKKQQEYIDQICKKLSVAFETVQRVETDFDQLRNDSLRSTGSWLESVDAYKRWIDLEDENGWLLLLSGRNGCGKSHLASAILEQSKTQFSTSSSSPVRISLASCRFVKNEKSSRNLSIKDSLNAMAVQIAKQDTVYSKNLSTYLETKDQSSLRDISVHDLPKELFPPPNMKDTADTAYILVFDGLDQMPLDDAKQLLTASLTRRSPKTRILITGTEDVFESCLKSFEASIDQISSIWVADFNKTDIKGFIESEIKSCSILQGEAQEILTIKESIRTKLPDIVDGNFEDVRQIIERVSEAVEADDSVEDIRELISKDTLRGKDFATEGLLNELNGSLNSQEIEQLNELLIWTIYAFEYMTADKMRAAIFLRTHRMPLQSLEDKVAQKYSKLLEFGTDHPKFLRTKSAYLEEFFRNSKRAIQEADVKRNDDPKISMTITIDHVKLSKVQRFFWDLSEKVLLDKFTFSDSLPDPAESISISANETEAHLVLTKRCFDLLLDEPCAETMTLAEYALMNLPLHLLHLRKAVDGNLLDSNERVDVIENLVTLLQSADCIEKCLTKPLFGLKFWINFKSWLEAMQYWLSNPPGIGLTRRSTSWLRKVKAGRIAFAFKDIATMIARHWLCYRTWPPEFPFQWIDAFLKTTIYDQAQSRLEDESQWGNESEASSSEQEGTEESDDDPRDTEPIRGRILRAAEWAQNEAGLTKSALVHERLGKTYLHYDEVGLSKAAFLTAKELPNCSWKASEGLAEAYAKSDQIELAVKENDIVFAYLRGKEDLSTDERSSFVQGLNKSAGWQTERKNTADAICKLREAICVDEQYYKSYYNLLKVLVDTEQISEALKMLGDMGSQPAKNGSLTQLGSMLLEFLQWGDTLKVLELFETVLRVVREHDVFQVILQTMETLLASARDAQVVSNMIDLLLCYGVAIAHYSTEGNRYESALKQWKECCRLGSQPGNSEKLSSAFVAAKFVFNYHCSHARSAQNVAKDVENHESTLIRLAESIKDVDLAYRLRLSLGSFYSLSGKRDAARKLLLNNMKSGIDLLSDDDLENDYVGYGEIARVLMHTGDDLNALSAWTLYGPSERHKIHNVTSSESAEEVTHQSDASPPEIGPPTGADEFGVYCDGYCNKPVTWADSIWFCKMCDDVQLHDECLAKLREDKLDRFVCSPDHEWLRVPSWVDEYRATGKGRVRVGGELQDGKRAGGQIVPVGEWLDRIREDWDIEKPAPKVQVEDDHQTDQGET